MANIVYVGPLQGSPEAKVFATTYPVIFFSVQIYPDSVGITLFDEKDIDFRNVYDIFGSFSDKDSNFFETLEYYFETKCERQIKMSFMNVYISIQ